LQLLADRYPRFATANVANPISGQASLFMAECDRAQLADDSAAAQHAGRRWRLAAGVGLARPRGGGAAAWEGGFRLSADNASKPPGQDGPPGAEAAADPAAEGQCVLKTAAWLNTWVALLQAGLSVAFVAVLETLMSAKLAAKATRVKFNQRREVRLPRPAPLGGPAARRAGPGVESGPDRVYCRCWPSGSPTFSVGCWGASPPRPPYP
jgi:hypothetical protein